MPTIEQFWSQRKPGVLLTAIHEPTTRQCPPDEMLQRACDDVAHWFDGCANLPPAFYADFGTISMVRPWGGRVEAADGRPFIHPAAATLDEALDLEPVANDDVTIAAAVYRRLCQRTGRDDIRFMTPDFQGTLNTASMVLDQTAFLMAMIEEPDKLHRLLDRVTDVNIATIRRALELAGRLDGNIWPYIWVPHTVGVMITEDMMPLLSPQQYREFGLPYLKRVSDAFGGVFIHCCGEWGRHAEALAASGVNVLGVEFHYPFTRYEQIREHLPQAVLVPYLAEFRTKEFAGYVAYIEHLLDQLDPSARLWIPLTDAPGSPFDALHRLLDRRGIEPLALAAG